MFKTSNSILFLKEYGSKNYALRKSAHTVQTGLIGHVIKNNFERFIREGFDSEILYFSFNKSQTKSVDTNMSVGRIYSSPGYFRIHKPLIAAKLAGVEVEFDPSFKYAKDNCTPEYLEKFPLGQIPAFESKDGNFRLVESTAIALHFANLSSNERFRGTTIEEKGLINQFIFFAETQLLPAAFGVCAPVLGFTDYIEKPYLENVEKLKKHLGYLESVLKDKKYLVGDQVTVADVIVSVNLEMAFLYYLDKSSRDNYPNVTRYFTEFYGLDKVKEIVPECKLCEVALKP